MAIEAHLLNYFPSQLIQNRDTMNNNIETKPNVYYYNPLSDYGLPLSGITTESLLPFYSFRNNNNNNSVFVNLVPDTFETTTTTTAAMKAESDLTYNNMIPRKRFRETPLVEYSGSQKVPRNGSVSFLGEDVTPQIQQQELEMDSLITQHMEKVRLLILQRRKEQSRRIVNAIEERMMKRLKEKDEQIEKSLKLNWLLEERMKALFLENQMWRNLAETNEATANALRTNLEQILSHQVKEKEEGGGGGDAESCCGSSDGGVGTERGGGGGACGTSGSRSRLCRKCGEEESCVVLLPCRHLCLCSVCAPTLHRCPVCDSDPNGSLHVNMS